MLGFESFRIGVELLVHRLWEDGLVPKLLTYEGGNVDMVFGLSAPIIAWLATTGRLGLRLAIGWNVLAIRAIAARHRDTRSPAPGISTSRAERVASAERAPRSPRLVAQSRSQL